MLHLPQLILIIGLCNHVCCYNILAIISLPLKSHYMAFGELFRELAMRGHNVTVINNFPDESPAPNLQFIPMAKADTIMNVFPRLETYEKTDWRYSQLYNIYRHISYINVATLETDCENIFSTTTMRPIEDNKYDVIFVEQFMSDCALAFAGAVFDTPIIGITSHILLPWMYSRLGLPFNSATDPFYFTAVGSHSSFFNKIEAFLYHHVFNTIGRWRVQRPIYEKFRKYRPGYNLDIERIATDRMKMVFSYQHFSFARARVLAPQVLEIAGLHVKKPKALPKDIATFLNKAEHGAVLIGLGSNLNMGTMSEEKLEEFLEAFKRIAPLKVLLKWENGSLDDENVLTRSWFPQLDLLCHPKVVAFVSHGGMLSTSEAASCGVPMIVMPFFGDQFGNAGMLAASGLGVILHFQQLNRQTLSDAIKVVTSEAMQTRAKEISELWHDRPMSALDSAVYWTEYVARHPNAPPSLPTKHSDWQESLVYASVIVFLLAIVLVLYFTMLILFGLITFITKCVRTKEKVA